MIKHFAAFTGAVFLMALFLLTGAERQASAQAYAMPCTTGQLWDAGNITCAVTSAQFVSGFTPASPGLKANLLSNAPCGSANTGSYAVVTDLFSSTVNTNEVMRCGVTGTTYYWRPQRTDFAANLTSTGGTMTVTCLLSPPTMFLTGTLASPLTITLATTNCWPGARFDVANNLVLGLNTATVTGLIGGVTKLLGLNVHSTFVFDGTAWQFLQ